MSKKPFDYWEARFEFALRQIAAYMSPSQLRRKCERTYGLDFEEALEMAYENVRDEAQSALKGYRRRPKQATAEEKTKWVGADG